MVILNNTAYEKFDDDDNDKNLDNNDDSYKNIDNNNDDHNGGDDFWMEVPCLFVEWKSVFHSV